MSESTAPVTAAPPSSSAEPKTAEATNAPLTGKSEAAPPANLTAAEKKIWKLKDGDQEYEFDASDEETVKREVMKGRAANKRFEEAAKMRKQAEQFIEKLRTDPKSILLNPKLGVDIKKLAEEILWEDMQEQALSPDQKRQRDIERELAKYKDAESKTKQEQEAREAQELHQRYAADYEKQIMSALETGGIPKTKATVARMANLMFQAVKAGYELEPADLVAQVRKDYIADIQSLFGSADADLIEQLLGDGIAKKLREKDLKKLRDPQTQRFVGTKADAPKQDAKPKKLSSRDWEESVKRGFLGR